MQRRTGDRVILRVLDEDDPVGQLRTRGAQANQVRPSTALTFCANSLASTSIMLEALLGP